MIRTFNTILLAVIAAFLVVFSPEQGRSQQASTTKSKAGTAAQSSNTPGRIAKFSGNGNGSVSDSNITEDSSGKIGIGTTTPTSPLTVQGMIETTLGGYKFPDGTLQTSAGLTSVFRDNTLNGNGTAANPLGIAVPLNLTGSSAGSAVLSVEDTTKGGRVQLGVSSSLGFVGGTGVSANGGNGTVFGGTGIDVTGGQSVDTGGIGVFVNGGFGNKTGGNGVSTRGGDADDFAGQGIVAQGGTATKGGGFGVSTRGGNATGVGNFAGDGIISIPGTGFEGAARGRAGRFVGDVQIDGTLSKAGGSFKIDHPLDPENKYLSHSFVESPDMMNIYNGNITTDSNGRAVVELPDWFEALNKDFRYQLTVVGQFAQAIVAEEVKGNHFVIQTNAPGVKVSWQVTGIRQDAWANKNRIKVEEVKSEKERGHYLHPEAFGQPEERGTLWAQQPELMRQLKQSRLEAEQSRKPKQ